MTYLLTELSKYTMIILIALYAYACFSSLRRGLDERRQLRKYRQQMFYLYLFHANAYAVLFLSTENPDILMFYGMQVVFFTAVFILYGTVYRKAAKLVVNNMCMLLAIGFVILTRLSYEAALRQFEFAVVAMGISLLIPLIISRFRFVSKLTWIYAFAGIGILGAVAVVATVNRGARRFVTIGGVTIQPSEFVKIIFIFCMAGLLYESIQMAQLIKATAIAALHVLILVISTDLGTGLTLFIAYLVMLYVATRKPLYLIGGLLAGSLASVVAYHLFSHVRVRVLAWQDPLGHFEQEGNQMSQSLFAIGTGGWFGMGLNRGMPNRIPEARSDFIFSAISEELGGIFAICLILVCVSCFLMFLNIAMQMKDQFYKLVALGLGTLYGFQVFLTIGGNIKFIPSTGVTLPLVSSGGSSLLSTMILFAIIQGLYLLRQREGGAGTRGEKSKGRPEEITYPGIKYQ